MGNRKKKVVRGRKAVDFLTVGQRRMYAEYARTEAKDEGCECSPVARVEVFDDDGTIEVALTHGEKCPLADQPSR